MKGILTTPFSLTPGISQTQNSNATHAFCPSGHFLSGPFQLRLLLTITALHRLDWLDTSLYLAYPEVSGNSPSVAACTLSVQEY